jgi:vacuolar-type H+-ATPase subunit E/Vma4
LVDKQVLDVARHVVLKQQVLDEMLQSETEYVNNLNTFNEVYALRLQPWLSAATDKDIVAKFKMTPAKTNLDTLFENLHGIAGAHSSFLKELKERFVLEHKYIYIYILVF